MTKKRKKSEKQYWQALDAAQINEKKRFEPLLHDLCNSAGELEQKRGRPRLPLADILFSMVMKVYCAISCRRSMSDLHFARERGFLSRVPSYNRIFRYFGMEVLRFYLVQLIIRSSLPLRTVEKDFAVDSTGFSTATIGRWVDFRYGNLRSGDRRQWLKAHIMCGVTTNIVTAVEVTESNAGDAPYFEPLLDTTTQNFGARHVAGDKAYMSLANLKYARSKDVMPVIPFRSNAKPVHGSGDPLWTRLYHFYAYNTEWFRREYHKRSNAESTNAMIKMKFGERLRSRTRPAQVNELLCKVLCHNICVTIRASYELGIDPTSWDEVQEEKAA